jgi:predicted deacylase
MLPRFDLDGKSWGILPVPHSSHISAYGQIEVPVGIIKNGAGPTVLLVAGNHGDEYEGQIALRRLFHEIDPAHVNGRIVIVPAANPPAVYASSRTSPLDQGNLNRLFPGDKFGGPTSATANAITDILLPHANYLIDLHSGGSSLEYSPCTILQRVRDEKIYEIQENMARAFGAPLSLVYDALPGLERSLSGTAIGLGVPSIATELGGGGGCTPGTVKIGYRGIQAVLAHLGVLEGGAAKPSDNFLFVNTNTDYLRSPDDGFFEPHAALGDEVQEGQIAGLLYRFSDLDEVPRPLHFGRAGVVVCRRTHTKSSRGDCLFHTAKGATST